MSMRLGIEHRPRELKRLKSEPRRPATIRRAHMVNTAEAALPAPRRAQFRALNPASCHQY
jgi:hypothetical protein